MVVVVLYYLVEGLGAKNIVILVVHADLFQNAKNGIRLDGMSVNFFRDLILIVKIVLYYLIEDILYFQNDNAKNGIRLNGLSVYVLHD